MLAKIIAGGRTREEAAARLVRALEDTHAVIEGGAVNKTHLITILRHPDFAASQLDTGWLDRLNSGPAPAARHGAAALVVAAIDSYEAELAHYQTNFFAQAGRGRPELPRRAPRYELELHYGENSYRILAGKLAPTLYRLDIDGQRVTARLERGGAYLGRLHYAGRKHQISSVIQDGAIRVEVDGELHVISRDSGGTVRAPAPAIVLAIHVNPGDTVREGHRLITLEAMKMEMTVTAPSTGTIRQIFALKNVQVGAGDPLLLLEPDIRQQSGHAAQRVQFCADDQAPGRLTSATLADVHQLLLGFDIDRRDTDQLVQWLKSPALELPPGLAADIPVLLSKYLDIEELFSKEDTRVLRGGPAVLSSRELLLQYLRLFQSQGEGLPIEYLDKLRRAAAHYGVTGLEPDGRLMDALMWLFKSRAQILDKNRVVLAVLSLCLRPELAPALTGDQTLRGILDRLILLTWGSYQVIADTARQVYYALFDAPLIASRRAHYMSRADELLEQALRQPPGHGHAAAIAGLVEIPQPLMGHVGPRLTDAAADVRLTVMELMTARFYRQYKQLETAGAVFDGEAFAIAKHTRRGRPVQVIATFGQPAQLKSCLGKLRGLPEQSHKHETFVDFYIPLAAADDRDAVLATAVKLVQTADLGLHIARICFIFICPGERTRYNTIRRSEQGWEAPDQRVIDIHPAMFDRLELWRLRNFAIQRLPSPEAVQLYHCQALANPKDERFIATCEVRDATPLWNRKSGRARLPELEHRLNEACYAMRQAHSQRAARDRLIWNRILLYVRPPLPLTRNDLEQLARRLQPPIEGLGIEKVMVRARFAPPGGVPDSEDTIISVSQIAGQDRIVKFSRPSDRPISTMTPYDQNVIRALRTGMSYPYEIIRMLTPGPGDTGPFPPGDFEELELAEGSWDAPRLVSAGGRPFGGNQANLVVGIIRNRTPKHPEGMARVIILGDGTRQMGALAAPECARIIGALDLAEQLQIPVDWFPVSSGAKIAMDSGTENLDWTARVLRRIVEGTQRGLTINIVVDGINVGAQSYWNAEATMLPHTRGCLIMTARGAMLLTGKKALDYSGSISAEDNLGIGGFERVMGPNGQAQYFAQDLTTACQILFRIYEHTYIAPGELAPRPLTTRDKPDRDICLARYSDPQNLGFTQVGQILSDAGNPGRKKPFDIRQVLRAVIDRDSEPLERWQPMRDADNAVVWDAHIGGWPVCLCGIESRPIPRYGFVPGDGPESWMGGTLFPLSSKKIARAVNAASGNRPTVFLANLSGFDGSPESLRKLQLEYGAEIGRAIVNFRGPLIFAVIARYHGGAYVVFSKTLNPNIYTIALTGSFASVIGGAPAAAVVFQREVLNLSRRDPRIREWEQQHPLNMAPAEQQALLRQEYQELFQKVQAEKMSEVGEQFDAIHTVQRALRVGSLDAVIEPSQLRPAVIAALQRRRAASGGASKSDA